MWMREEPPPESLPRSTKGGGKYDGLAVKKIAMDEWL
jgi:hypothetical protein